MSKPILAEGANRHGGPLLVTAALAKKDLLIILLATGIASVPLYWLGTHLWSRFGVDWTITYYPTTMLLLHGANPYQIVRLHNPVWTLFPMIPFALLGLDVGRFALLWFNLFSMAYVAYRMRPKPIAYAAFLISPLVFYNLVLANVDVLVLWGLLLPPPWSLFLFATKPQLGAGLIVYQAYQIWKKEGLAGLAWSFSPLVVALGATFLLYGNWLIDKESLLEVGWNASLFPWSIPIGLALLAVALFKVKEWRLAITASPMLSPYTSTGSWAVALIGLIGYPAWMVGITFGAWILYLYLGVKFIIR